MPVDPRRPIGGSFLFPFLEVKMGYFHYNPNPYHKSVGDCAVRAISKALGQDWEQTYVWLSVVGFCTGDMADGDQG